MSGPGLQTAFIVATNLLTFESATAGAAREVTVDVRAVSIQAARRQVSLGTTVMYSSRFTKVGAFSVFLGN